MICFHPLGVIWIWPFQNSFIDDEAEEEQEEVDEHESDQGSLDNSESNEEGVSGDVFDESVLESSSDDDLELADLVMNPQRRVMRKKIIISGNDDFHSFIYVGSFHLQTCSCGCAHFND